MTKKQIINYTISRIDDVIKDIDEELGDEKNEIGY